VPNLKVGGGEQPAKEEPSTVTAAASGAEGPTTTDAEGPAEPIIEATNPVPNDAGLTYAVEEAAVAPVVADIQNSQPVE
jgi:hypothetical protein